MITIIKKENVCWVNNKIKGENNCIDLEVINTDKISRDDLCMLPNSRIVYVKQADFDRFKNMPRATVGQVIRIIPVSNEKISIEQLK